MSVIGHLEYTTEFLNQLSASFSAETYNNLAAVHRRRPNLRSADSTHAESLLRGAKLSGAHSGALEASIRAYSVLIHPLVTFRRAPLHTLATCDLHAGGDGTPPSPTHPATRSLVALAALLTENRVWVGYGLPLGALFHALILSENLFGSRSLIIARIAARLCACDGGADPKGLGVPEVYWGRHREQEVATARTLAEEYLSASSCSAHGIRVWNDVWLHAAKEAENIALSASRS